MFILGIHTPWVIWPGENGGEGRQNSLLNTEYTENDVFRDLQSNVEIHKIRTNVKNNLEIVNCKIFGGQGSV